MIDWSCFGPEKKFITYCGQALSYQIQEDIYTEPSSLTPLPS